MKAAIVALLAILGAAHAFTGSAGIRPRTHLMAASSDDEQILSRRSALGSFLAGAAAVASGVAAPGQAGAADGSRTIAQISGSGIVTLYVSNFERPLTERVQKDFFTEPSYASVTCVKTGPVEIADNIDKSSAGEPVFQEKRSLLFKELRVQRIYDEQKKALVYVSFNTRLDKGSDSNKSRFKSSICAVPLE
ncbi:hypothetical protein ACHAXT_011144 [Thalassiosira profunda]